LCSDIYLGFSFRLVIYHAANSRILNLNGLKIGAQNTKGFGIIGFIQEKFQRFIRLEKFWIVLSL